MIVTLEYLYYGTSNDTDVVKRVLSKKKYFHDVLIQNGGDGDMLMTLYIETFLEGMHAFTARMSHIDKCIWIRKLINEGFLTKGLNNDYDLIIGFTNTKNPSAYTKILHAINPHVYPYIYDSHIRTALGFKSDTKKARQAFEQLTIKARQKVQDWLDEEIYQKESESWRDYKLYM